MPSASCQSRDQGELAERRELKYQRPSSEKACSVLWFPQVFRSTHGLNARTIYNTRVTLAVTTIKVELPRHVLLSYDMENIKTIWYILNLGQPCSPEAVLLAEVDNLTSLILHMCLGSAPVPRNVQW